MFLEIELSSIFGSVLKPNEEDYEEARRIIERQIKAELGWKVFASLRKEDWEIEALKKGEMPE